ncbi:FERM, ARHGEF and pleckstrin domain-containing protein 1-like isoform X2 [Anneissia japonica]|uniref:FERM, ARHGEF and pleckstrin domain-containing protein 1-like isoform X2 n=1 Tax=Anneissia japonica TaxID=1529436 RepID=UPI001425ADD7|nr:FERM, ARHGEF and pleckstrin domain-containing protein 1-like isoform X2 [Anneissia japonica]
MSYTADSRGAFNGSASASYTPGNHTLTLDSQDHLSEPDQGYSYGYTPSITPTHSYSTARSEPGTLQSNRSLAARKGKLMPLKVQMLDDSIVAFQLPSHALGVDLLEACCQSLNLLESDYFGLQFYSKDDVPIWLDSEKMIIKQLAAPKKTNFLFTVKFYIPDPGQLQDEFTKYLYALQIKKDLANGKLPCSENTAALMASYVLQAEVGDYNPTEHDNGMYITIKFVPNQTKQLEAKIQEYHKNHVGQTPADADFNLLDVARRLEMYGVHTFPAKDYENIQLFLAVTSQGVSVFQNNMKINTFSWAKIRKLSFKRKRFLVKLHPEGYGYPRSTVEFLLGSRNDCKRFWKNCVEHHTFFRHIQAKRTRPRRRLMSRGSSFRYSGRTQKQVTDQIRDGYVRRTGVTNTLNASRVSTRSLGAPRTTTPLTIDMTDPAISDHQIGGGDSRYEAYNSHTIEHHYDYQPPDKNDVEHTTSGTEAAWNTDVSSAPTTPQHSNSRIVIQRGQSDSSNLYEYQVNDDDGTNGILSGDEGRSSVHSFNPASPTRKEPIHVEYATQSAPEDVRPADNTDRSEAYVNIATPPMPAIKTTAIIQEEPVAHPPPEEETGRKKRHSPDRAYFIAKEILTTERTYLKDIEVIVVWFRKAVTNESNLPEILEILFSNLDPIYDFHCKFLKEVEQRLATWEGRSNAHLKGNYQRIGDVMLKNIQNLKLYTSYIEKIEQIITELEVATKKNKKFEHFYKDFELQKVCYLPFNTFLLKPVQRLLHYRVVLERLVKHYPQNHPDFKDCKAALAEISELSCDVKENMQRIENFQKLTELRRDLVGIDNLVAPGREFLREGCLHKLSRKGYQQRMFFLFSDTLMYSSKGLTPTNQFKVHGQIPLKGIKVEDEQNRQMTNCFTITGSNKPVVIAASTPEEKQRWMHDINTGILISEHGDKTAQVGTLDPDPVFDESEEEHSSPRGSLDRIAHHRANTTVHVCWHRNTSVSMADHQRAVENQLSGYLLRKFKNSNGWQKLWVVFTNFCLFFYKSYQDDYPLASLPLLGYTVEQPSESDDIKKDYVFKLQFKTHVYFFRAESEYTYGRWIEVLGSATFSSKVDS